MLAIPNLLLTIVVVSILEPSLTNATLAIAVVSIPSYVRLTRAAVLNEKNRDYVTSSRVAGASVLRLMFIVILPNCLAPLIVQMTMGISNAILELATLGFLGIGAKPPTPELGTMLSESRSFMQAANWLVTIPGLVILSLVLAFNLMGDGLRDALDPKLNNRGRMALLDVKELSVHFGDEKAPFKAVDRISYQVNQGEVLGIVGESGSGKSVSSLAVMGLIDFPGRVSAKGLEFEGKDLLSLPPKEKRELVGADIAMIFQDPMTSLNPAYTVGFQIMEQLRRIKAVAKKNAVSAP